MSTIWKKLQPVVLVLLVCLSGGTAAALHESGAASAQTNMPSAKLVATYFADLKAGRFHAAYLLEATCDATWTIRRTGGAPPETAGMGGTGGTVGGSVHVPIRSYHIASIVQFHHPLLTRLHFLGFYVSGWFTFVYAPVSASNPGLNERRNGYHRIVIIVRRCGNRWGISPSWLVAEGGGPPIDWR